MIYRPPTGSLWDPSIIIHDGLYYAIMMYNREGGDGLAAEHCLLATSSDGVHWGDEGVVVEERERAQGCRLFKCFVGRFGMRAAPGAFHSMLFYENGFFAPKAKQMAISRSLLALARAGASEPEAW